MCSIISWPKPLPILGPASLPPKSEARDCGECSVVAAWNLLGLFDELFEQGGMAENAEQLEGNKVSDVNVGYKPNYL